MTRFVSIAAMLSLLTLPCVGASQPYDPVPGPSRFGPEDQAGASNTQGPAKVKEAQKLIKRGIVLQLGHVYEEGMPQFPGTHPWKLSALDPIFVTPQQFSIGESLEGPIEIGQLGTQLDTVGHFGYLPQGSLILVKSGIPMQESMHLQELAAAEVYEFAYIYSPMPIKGASGSPGIPLAVY